MEDLSNLIASKDCINNKTEVIKIYTKLKSSLNSGFALYNEMLLDINGTEELVKWKTPGETSF